MLASSLAAGRAEPATELAVGEQPRQCSAQRSRIAWWYDQAGLAVHDEVAQPADAGRHDRAGMGHGLQTSDAEPLPAGWAGNNGRACVQTMELVVRNEPACLRNLPSKRPVPRDDEIQAPCRVNELEHPFLD
jgi:hypothetical protein